MKKKSNKIKNILIPLMLFGIWIGLTFIQMVINDGSLSVVTRRYPQKEIPSLNLNKILQGQTRQFEFTADYENLGYVSINFDMTNKGREDFIEMRMFEKQSGKIIKEHVIFAGAFEGLNYYPFGFPIIRNSTGKSYLVEIKSRHGTEQNFVSIKNASSVFSASYQYEKNKILSDRKYALDYFQQKVINSFLNNYLLFTTSIYLYPFIFYLLWLYFEKNVKNSHLIHNPIFALLCIAVITDIFLVDSPFDLVFLIISILWGGMLMYLHRGGIVSYKAALPLLILCPIFQLFGWDVMVEKAASWAFLALTVGVIMNVYELKKHPERFEE